jgi:hypothetical protein
MAEEPDNLNVTAPDAATEPAEAAPQGPVSAPDAGDAMAAITRLQEVVGQIAEKSSSHADRGTVSDLAARISRLESQMKNNQSWGSE